MSSEPPPDGEKRLAVVTGGAGGIGRATCRHLGGLGYHVVALGRDADALDDLERTARTDGFRLAGHRCDVTDEEAVTRVAADLPATPRVLVHAAGLAETDAVHKTSSEDWHRHLAVNATAAFLLTRALLPGMREHGWGRVVAVASTAALAGTRYTAAYTASKHALLGLVRVLATELAGTGVTCNAVCPSFVRSAMTDRSAERIATRTGRSAAQAKATLAGSSPLGRLVEPTEVAAAIGYLASGAAGCVNGQTLVLDGGGIQT